MNWRDDGLHPNEEPTVNMVVTVAMDTLDKKGGLELVICHVKTFPHGPAFMPSVRGLGGYCSNGYPSYVYDDNHRYKSYEAYQKAAGEGMKLLIDKLNRDKELEQERRAWFAKIKRSIDDPWEG